MTILYVVTAIALAASVIASRRRTVAAITLAGRRLARILPAFLLMIALFSVAVTLLPRDGIMRLLGADSGWRGLAIASAAGSATLMPGFIAFPLCGALRAQGVGYMVLAAFTTICTSFAPETSPSAGSGN